MVPAFMSWHLSVNDYGVAPVAVEHFLLWLTRLIFDLQSQPHQSHVKSGVLKVGLWGCCRLTFRLSRFAVVCRFSFSSPTAKPLFTMNFQTFLSSACSSQSTVSMSQAFMSRLHTSVKRSRGRPLFKLTQGELRVKRVLGDARVSHA